MLRQRWAWVILVAFNAAVLVGSALDFPGALAVLLNVVTFALLVSPPMRGYLRANSRARF